MTLPERAHQIDRLLAVYSQLTRRLARLHFASPVAHTYHTLDYAWPAFEHYLRAFACRGARAVLLGMNPGPWGMVQTGVPFGDVASVRNWLRIDAAIHTPRSQHPRRPVLGLSCPRIEVSGQRIWSWAERRYRSTDAFFQSFFVLNYCPLAWLADSGANITPDKLPVAERQAVEAACDDALRDAIRALNPQWLIGVGKYAELRARAALANNPSIQFGTILHPSPASPAANRGWAEQAEQQLAALGIETGPASKGRSADIDKSAAARIESPTPAPSRPPTSGSDRPAAAPSRARSAPASQRSPG